MGRSLPSTAAPSRKPTFRRGLNRIVGGQDATPGQFPYQLSFQDTSFGFDFHFCGASIYSENWAVCAGHCVQGEDMNNPNYLKVFTLLIFYLLFQANSQYIATHFKRHKYIIFTYHP